MHVSPKPRKKTSKKRNILSKKNEKILDFIVDFVIILVPLTLLPQIYVIWVNGDTEGVSMATWALQFVLTIPLVIYDIVHRVHKLALMHVLLTTGFLLIVIGLLVKG